MSLILRNGQTWENQAGERAIVQWLGGEAWCLLRLPEPAPFGGTQMIPVVTAAGKTLFATETLAELLAREHWRRIPHFGMELPEHQAAQAVAP